MSKNNDNQFLLFNQEAEIVVLSTAIWLCRDGNFDSFTDSMLSKELFHDPKNITIFEVVNEMIKEEGVIPDMLTITDKILHDGIKDITPSDIVERTEFYPGYEVNFSQHIGILRDLALRRKAKAVSEYLLGKVVDPTVDIVDVVEEIEILKADASAMASGTFSQFYKGADKQRIRELLGKRGENLSTGYHFGFEELMIPPKALTFIVGATGHCKSTFLSNLALRVCDLHPDKKILFISYEEALESVYVNLLNIYTKVNLGDNNRNIIANHTIADGDVNKLLKVSPQEYDDYRHFLDNKQNMVEFAEREIEFYKLVDDGHLNIQYLDFPLDMLSSFIKEMVRKGLCDIAFIDYVQLLNAPTRSKYRSREDELKEICISLKNLAVDEKYGLPIVFGAQFNRQVKSARDLQATNIGEAGDIERIANTIVALWNCQKTEEPANEKADEEICKYQGTKTYNESAIFAKILKRRGYASGLTATFPFEGNTGRILDRGDATTEEINHSQPLQQKIVFENDVLEDNKEYRPF